MKRHPKPPITGMPAKRARCVGCNCLLRPYTKDTTEKVVVDAGFAAGDEDGGLSGRVTGFHTVVVAREFAGWMAYGGLFHSLRCALRFAVEAHAAGYRRGFTS